MIRSTSVFALALVLALALDCTVAAHASAEAALPRGDFAGVVIRPDDRFDPLIQRLMARADLRAMPIGETGLLYLAPVVEDPYQRDLQIRFLHDLLESPQSEPPRSVQ